jgi:Ni,Fe-hydrogenase III large subunit
LCGNRFGRGLVRAGGCRFDLEPARALQMLERLEPALEEVDRAATWLWDAASVRRRFEHVGVVFADQAADIGLVGPAARACALVRDVRYDQPTGWFRFAQVPIAVWPGGDVLARARVRWLEIQHSGQFLREQLAAPHASELFAEPPPPAADRFAAALVEGWRGEVCHAAVTDGAGRFLRYKLTDPSFHNWTGLALALRAQAISDFPLCNKSFNLSYCGFDL